MKKLIAVIILLGTAVAHAAPQSEANASAKAESASEEENLIVPSGKLSGPLLRKRASKFSKWKITPPKEDDTKAETTITKTGPVIKVHKIDAKGAEYHVWHKDGLQVAQWPDGRIGIVPKPSVPEVLQPLYKDFSETDFSEFSWITEENFVGIEEDGESIYKVFATELQIEEEYDAESEEAEATSPPESMAVRAHIDYNTRLPAKLEIDESVTTYTFETPVFTVQELPEEVKAIIDKNRSLSKKLQRIPRP